MLHLTLLPSTSCPLVSRKTVRPCHASSPTMHCRGKCSSSCLVVSSLFPAKKHAHEKSPSAQLWQAWTASAKRTPVVAARATRGDESHSVRLALAKWHAPKKTDPHKHQTVSPRFL